MPISRRIFMRTGTMVVLGAAAQAGLAKMVIGKQTGRVVDAVSGFRVPAGSMNDPLTFYTKATFTAHLNSKFLIRRVDSSNSTMTLVKVADFAPSTSKRGAKIEIQAGKGECFSLVFSGIDRLPQGTYTVEHGALGTFKLFLVPSGKSGAAPQWDAVINRLYS